jgi:hypothetical protein
VVSAYECLIASEDYTALLGRFFQKGVIGYAAAVECIKSEKAKPAGKLAKHGIGNEPGPGCVDGLEHGFRLHGVGEVRRL